MKHIILRILLMFGMMALLLGCKPVLENRLQLFDYVISWIAYPLLKIHHSITKHGRRVRMYFEKHAVLLDKVEQLYEERDAARSELTALQGCLSLVNDLSEIIEFKYRYLNADCCISQILARHFDKNQHYILIEGGFNRHFERDMVVVYKNNLVGRIVEVFPTYSKVIVITDPSCKIGVRCAGTGAVGIHHGKSALFETEVSFVSHLQKVMVDDYIMTSGEGLIFPRGFAVGKIKEIHTDELYHKITVEPFVDFTNLDSCIVLSKGFEYY